MDEIYLLTMWWKSLGVNKFGAENLICVQLLNSSMVHDHCRRDSNAS